MKHFYFFICIFFIPQLQAQQPVIKPNDTLTESPFKSGFYPVSFFDVNLRTLIKYNNYEGFRLGFGGITNDKLFKNIKVGGYVAYGFKDRQYKYKIGGGIRLHKKQKLWINSYYINDIKEVGSHPFLTDKLVYSVFEPRLINITQFYKHQTWQINFQNNLIPSVLSELLFTHQNIQNILNYTFILNQRNYTTYKLSEITLSTQFNLFKNHQENKSVNFPIISAQITQGIKNVFNSDFNYTKLGLKLNYILVNKNKLQTSFLVEGNWAKGDIPLTHLFHSYPNSPTKDKILQRFSVAGTNSFETMYFGEFFSDKLATAQIKHTLYNFKAKNHTPASLLLVTRHAIGTLLNPQKHIGINFNTLDHLYSESGIEINNLFMGFGLSFNYRYGFYYLPDFEDNISIKFTFNLKI